ncbi:GIY-YIG nuclease family protein [Mesorhizobium sp. BR1-1-13]|nr:GIY-YIG nuclease family protein [Mesorhizobium sp. BR1-1-13]
MLGRVVLGEGNVSTWSRAKLDYLYALAHESKEHLPESSAVYVVGTISPSCVKVGKADSPARRLTELQTGNPDVLHIHRVFWFDNSKIAEEIEAKSHAIIATKNWRRLTGEWFECPPHVAHDAIVQASEHTSVRYCALTPCDEGMA